MAVVVNNEDLANRDANKEDYVPETQHIPEGTHPAVLVGYNELGKHYPIYNGVRNKYESGKRMGQLKDAELCINLVFEFPTCDYDNVPLTIETSIPYGTAGEFINKLPVSDALASGNISLSFANKSAFNKYKNAMNAALDTAHGGLHMFLGEKFLITVTNATGKPDKNGDCRVYANMKPEGITKPEFRHPMTKKVEVIDVPDPKGTYGPMFDWDEPTVEAWNGLKKNLKKCIRKAVNFEGSPIQGILAGMPDESDEAVPDPDAMPDNVPPKNTGQAASADQDDIPV